MKNLTLTLGLSFFISSLFACVNEFDYNPLDQQSHVIPMDGKIQKSMNKNEAQLAKEAKVLLALYDSTKNTNHYSDYGAKLIYLGKYKAAKEVYFKIEKTNPNQYATASNLGTLYELTGQNDSALFWIKKAIQLNPASHGGSEWIHVKILEFKMAGKSNYDQSILGLNFGEDEVPNKEDSKHNLSYHISHQLGERLNFIAPPNKIMGNIYFDYGNTIAFEAGITEALKAYDEAIRFGFESPVLTKRINQFKAIIAKHKVKVLTEKGDLKEDTVSTSETSIPDSSETASNAQNKQESNLKNDGGNERPKIDPKNGLIRTGLIILGGFVFAFIMFLVFRIKK